MQPNLIPNIPEFSIKMNYKLKPSELFKIKDSRDVATAARLCFDSNKIEWVEEFIVIALIPETQKNLLNPHFMAHMQNDPVIYKVRYWIKIVSGKSQGDVKTVYYRTDVPPNVFLKWLWYFKYREALERIKNPKFHIELTHGHYDYVPPVDTVIKVLTAKIRNRKGKLTEYTTKLRMARETWTQLFPIEDDDLYKKCLAKIARIEKEKSDMETELKSIISPKQ